MYAPLDFMEQIKTMAGAIDKYLTDEVMNQTNISFSEELFDSKEVADRFIRDFCTYFNPLMSVPDFRAFEDLQKYRDIRKAYNNKFDELVKDRGARYFSPDSDYDFFTQMMQQLIYYDWRFHKLSYKLSDYLGRQLINMDYPKNAYCRCYTNLPARTIYIDLSDVVNDICEDLYGIFLSTTNQSGNLFIVATAILKGKHGRIMPIFASSRLQLGNMTEKEIEEDMTPISFNYANKDIEPIVCEDGVKRKFDMSALFRFIANFLVYLQASNRDMEKNSVIKGNFDKPVDRTKEVKNKFRELRQYDLGYKISTPIPNKGKSSESKSGTGSPKSAHYRSAHWHHFWTGSGDDKKLIIKWVDGVFVNGKAEQDVAVVHTLK